MEVQPNPYLLQLRRNTLIVEEELPNDEKQILEEESKLVESSEDSVNSIFWGATDATAGSLCCLGCFSSNY